MVVLVAVVEMDFLVEVVVVLAVVEMDFLVVVLAAQAVAFVVLPRLRMGFLPLLITGLSR